MTKYYHEPARETKILEADVFVAGAGTAGCIAAVAAARAGAKVVIVEKMPVPSGTLSNGGNGIFSFYAQSQFPGDTRKIVDGLPYELLKRVERWGGCVINTNENDGHRNPVTPFFDHEILKGVLCEFLLDAGVKVLLQTYLCGVDVEDGVIKAAFIENKDGRTAIVAKQYIDCTGDGDFAKYCGVEQVSNWQDYDKVCGAATSLPLSMAGIDFDRAVATMPEVFRLYSKEEKPDRENGYCRRRYFLTVSEETEGCQELKDLHLRQFVSFSSNKAGHAGINNSKGVQGDCSSAETLSQAEMEMRIKNMKLAHALKVCVPGFEDSYIDWQALMLGIRATKATVCDKMLTQAEIESGTRFDDEIGLYGFHDLASERLHPELFIKNESGFYGFPYRMLLPVGVKNLFMAGRCVTTETVAHESTRNTVGCMIMGQGAGVAAALCAERNCQSRELPYAQLREKLLDQNVILDV